MWLKDEREKTVDIGSGSWIADVAAALGTDRLDLDALQEERTRRAREILREESFSAFLCLDPANIRYLTGLPPNPWGEEHHRARCALLTPGEGPFLLETGPAADSPKTWPAPSPGNNPERAIALGLDPDKHLSIPTGLPHAPGDALLNETAEFHRRLVHTDSPVRIGIDRPEETGTGPLPPFFADARSALLRARSLKDMEELEYLRFVTDIVDIAFQNARTEWVGAGAAERDAAARCHAFLIEMGFESVEAVLCAAGPNALGPVPSPTPREIEPGDMVIFGIRATGPGGYRVCAQRTFKCGGNVRPAENNLYRRCHQAMRLVMASCWPGRTARSLLDILDEDKGLPRPEGHALGLDWQEGFAIGPNEPPAGGWDETLTDNVYLTLRVHVREGDIAVGLEENFLVSPEGPVYFTCFPLEKELL